MQDSVTCRPIPPPVAAAGPSPAPAAIATGARRSASRTAVATLLTFWPPGPEGAERLELDFARSRRVSLGMEATDPVALSPSV